MPFGIVICNHADFAFRRRSAHDTWHGIRPCLVSALGDVVSSLGNRTGQSTAVSGSFVPARTQL
jgi:hypothetical protein